MSFRMHDYYQNYRTRERLDHLGGNIYGNCNLVDGDYYINGHLLLPTGMIIQHISEDAPYGWLVCDGRDVSINEYPRLYEVIGTKFGISDASDIEFRLPDFRARVPVGYHANRDDREIADTGGAETHTLTTNEMPSHTHTGTTQESGTHSHTGTTSTNGEHSHNVSNTVVQDGNNTRTVADNEGPAGEINLDTSTTRTTTTAGSHSHTLNIDTAGAHTHTFTTNSTGGGEAHNNMQPYLVVNYMIKW